MNRLLILIIAAGALVLGGCGTNKFNDLGSVSLIPDLVPKKITENTDSNASLNGELVYDVVIANEGAASARTFRVEVLGLHLNKLITCEPYAVGGRKTYTIDGLDAGDATNLTVRLNVPGPREDSLNYTGCAGNPQFDGEWLIQVTVDYDDAIIEGDEGNNVITTTINISVGGGGTSPPVTVDKPIAN